MPSTRDIRRRIKSVKGTAQITKAMQMVASSKMARAQQAALNGRPFAVMIGTLTRQLDDPGLDFRHPLMEQREIRKRGVIVVGTDKGLCGPLNSNLFREIGKYDAKTEFIAVGKRSGQFLARTKRKLVAEFTYRDTPTYGECEQISKFAQDLFLKGEVDAVDVLYTRFINTLSQRPEITQLLPIVDVESLRTATGAPPAKPAEETTRHQFIYEPDQATVIQRLMVYLLDFRVAQLLLEAKASEHSARMVAMKNATDNAMQLIKDLTLEYNKMRQASITKELLEISSAAMAAG